MSDVHMADPETLQPAAPPLPEQKPAPILKIEVEKTHQVAEFKHGLPLTCLRIDPTGRYVFAGAEDLNVYRWALDGDSKEKVTFAGHESWVRSMDFSPDGRWLYTGGYDDTVGFWRVDDLQPKPLRMLKAHAGWVRWVRINSDGRLMATCGNDNLVKVWRVNGVDEPELLHTFVGHERYPYAAEFHPDGRRIVSFDLMGVIKEWDLETGKELRSFEAKHMWGFDQKFRADMGGARDMRFSPDGKVLAVAGLTKVTNAFAGVHQPMITLFDWQTGEQIQQLTNESYKGLCWGVRFHPEGFLVSVGAPQGGTKGAVWFYKPKDEKSSAGKETAEKSDAAKKAGPAKKSEPADVPKIKPFHTVNLTHCGRGIDLTPNAQRFAVAQFDGFVRVYQMTAKAEA